MYHILINPASRSGRGHKIWKEQVEPALRRGNIPYRPYFSAKPGDVTRLAEEITRSADTLPIHLIVLGGDGTMNEVLQGLPDTSRAILGYIPTGSSNDLARALHIPTDPTKALDLILHTGCPTSLDMGTVTYPDGSVRHFCVSCGIGYDAAVCEEVLRSRMKKVLNRLGLGKLIYLGVALKQLFAARSISGRLTLDGEAPIDIGNMLFTCCMNHRFEGGGFMFAPAANPADGILDLCSVGDLSKLLILFALPTAFRGKHYRFQGVNPYRARSVLIETGSPMWVHTDGEVVRKASRIQVSCRQHGIWLITPTP